MYLRTTVVYAGFRPQYAGFAFSTTESPRLRAATTYGPVPTGLFARSATPVGLNIAPSRLVRLNSQPF